MRIIVAILGFFLAVYLAHAKAPGDPIPKDKITDCIQCLRAMGK